MMYAEKILMQAYKQAESDAIKLSVSLQALSKMVSFIYDKEIVAHFTSDGKIEFQHMLDDGTSDSFDTITIEDVYNKLNG